MGEREADKQAYLATHPNGEVKTVLASGRRPGHLRPWWRCRPVKGQGRWEALPVLKDQSA